MCRTWPTLLLAIIISSCTLAQDVPYGTYGGGTPYGSTESVPNYNQYFPNQNLNPNPQNPQNQNPQDRDRFNNNPYNPNPQDRDRSSNPYNTNQNQNPQDRFNNPYNTNQNQNPQDRFNNPYNTNTNNDPYGEPQDRFNPYNNNESQDRSTPRTTWRQNPFEGVSNYNPSGPLNPYDSNSVLITEATYFVVASRMIMPGQLYKVVVNMLQVRQPITVRASIQRNGVELSADSKDVKEGIPETLLMRVPATSVPGDYNLRVEGLYENILVGSAFFNETILTFSQRSMTIFIQLDKPVYMQGDTVRFRTIPINTELKAFDSAVDIYMLDPSRHIMRRWLSRQSNLGTVSLEYPLSDQPVFGDWTIQIVAQGQVEEAKFTVEEYYQTRFEVNVTMNPFFFTTDRYLRGVVHANYTSGAPVRGNLTLKATIRPRVERNYAGHPTYGRERDDRRDMIGPPQQLQPGYTGYRTQVVEKYFNFFPGCQEACRFHAEASTRVQQTQPVIHTKGEGVIKVVGPLAKWPRPSSVSPNTPLIYVVMRKSQSGPWRQIIQTLDLTTRVPLNSDQAGSTLRVLVVNLQGLVTIYSPDENSVRENKKKKKTINTEIKATTSKTPVTDAEDSKWVLREVSLIHQKVLVIGEIAWEPKTTRGVYLVTWEIDGGGLKGNLFTDSTCVTLSLWPDTVYHIQVELVSRQPGIDNLKSEMMDLDTGRAQKVSTESQEELSAVPGLKDNEVHEDIEFNSPLLSVLVSAVKGGGAEPRRHDVELLAGSGAAVLLFVMMLVVVLWRCRYCPTNSGDNIFTGASSVRSQKLVEDFTAYKDFQPIMTVVSTVSEKSRPLPSAGSHDPCTMASSPPDVAFLGTQAPSTAVPSTSNGQPQLSTPTGSYPSDTEDTTAFLKDAERIIRSEVQV